MYVDKSVMLSCNTLSVLFLSRGPRLTSTAPASLKLAKPQEKQRKATAMLTAGSASYSL